MTEETKSNYRLEIAIAIFVLLVVIGVTTQAISSLRNNPNPDNTTAISATE